MKINYHLSLSCFLIFSLKDHFIVVCQIYETTSYQTLQVHFFSFLFGKAIIRKEGTIISSILKVCFKLWNPPKLLPNNQFKSNLVSPWTFYMRKTRAASMVVPWVQWLLAKPTSWIRVPMEVPAVSVPIALPANVPGRAGEEEPSSWVPGNKLRYPNEVSAPSLSRSSYCCHLGTKQTNKKQMEDGFALFFFCVSHFLCLCVCLCVSASLALSLLLSHCLSPYSASLPFPLQLCVSNK